GLKVNAFARRIGADKNTQGFTVGVFVEGVLHLLTPVLAGNSREDVDARLPLIGVVEGFVQATLEPASRVFVLGEDDQTPAVPLAASQHAFVDPFYEPVDARVAPARVRFGEREHAIDNLELGLKSALCGTGGAQRGCGLRRFSVVALDRFLGSLV